MSCDNIFFSYEPSLGTATPGGATTLSNVGGGTELVNAISGSDYPIKTFAVGAGLGISVVGDLITLTNTAPGIADGTATDNTTRWDGTNWVENANLKAYSNGQVRITGVTTGGSFGITQVSGSDPFTITAGSTTRYISLIDNTSGFTEWNVSKGGSTYQKGNATLDNNSGLQLAELDANGSGTITIKSNANMGSSSYTVSMPAVQGGANTYLKNDGAGNLTWGSVAAGLTYWTESEYTYSGKTGTKLIPNSVNTNQSVVLQPKGTGFISARQPDGTTAGGNNRGDYAVDLQIIGSGAASRVASGAYSVISGGVGNTASNAFSVVGGGNDNLASGQQSVIGGGWQNIVSGLRSIIAGGDTNTASGEYTAIAGGSYNTASGKWSTVLGGLSNTAPSYGEVIMGYIQQHIPQQVPLLLIVQIDYL